MGSNKLFFTELFCCRYVAFRYVALIHSITFHIQWFNEFTINVCQRNIIQLDNDTTALRLSHNVLSSVTIGPRGLNYKPKIVLNFKSSTAARHYGSIFMYHTETLPYGRTSAFMYFANVSQTKSKKNTQIRRIHF